MHPASLLLLGSLLSAANRTLNVPPGFNLYIISCVALVQHLREGSSSHLDARLLLDVLLGLVPELLFAWCSKLPLKEPKAAVKARDDRQEILSAESTSCAARTPSSTSQHSINHRTPAGAGASTASIAACSYLRQQQEYRPYVKGPVQVHIKIRTNDEISQLPDEFGRSMLTQMQRKPVADNLLLINMAARPGCIMLSLECMTADSCSASECDLAYAVAGATLPYLSALFWKADAFVEQNNDDGTEKPQFIQVQVGPAVASAAWDTHLQSWTIHCQPVVATTMHPRISSTSSTPACQLTLARQHPTLPIVCTSTAKVVQGQAGAVYDIPAQLQLQGVYWHASGHFEDLPLTGWCPPAQSPGKHTEGPNSCRHHGGVLRVLASCGGQYLVTRVTGCEAVSGSMTVAELWRDELMLSSVATLLHLTPRLPSDTQLARTSPAGASPARTSPARTSPARTSLAPVMWWWGTSGKDLTPALAELQGDSDTAWSAAAEHALCADGTTSTCEISPVSSSTSVPQQLNKQCLVNNHKTFLLDLCVWLHQIEQSLTCSGHCCVRGCGLQAVGPQLPATSPCGAVLSQQQMRTLAEHLIVYADAVGLHHVQRVVQQQLGAVQRIARWPQLQPPSAAESGPVLPSSSKAIAPAATPASVTPVAAGGGGGGGGGIVASAQLSHVPDAGPMMTSRLSWVWCSLCYSALGYPCKQCEALYQARMHKQMSSLQLIGAAGPATVALSVIVKWDPTNRSLLGMVVFHVGLFCACLASSSLPRIQSFIPVLSIAAYCVRIVTNFLMCWVGDREARVVHEFVRSNLMLPFMVLLTTNESLRLIAWLPARAVLIATLVEFMSQTLLAVQYGRAWATSITIYFTACVVVRLGMDAQMRHVLLPWHKRAPRR